MSESLTSSADPEGELVALAKEIDLCAAAIMPRVKADLAVDGITDVDNAELFRVAQCVVRDDLRKLNNINDL